jgi:hypothetical protein
VTANYETAPADWCLPVSSWDNWHGDTVVIVPCSEAKLDHAAPASDLYTGSLFRMALEAARVLVPDDQIRVLSAMHGWVRLDQEIAPYEWRMARNVGRTYSPVGYDGPPCPMPLVLQDQARDQGIADVATVVSLCPLDYWHPVQRTWGDRAVNAFYGCRGIGDMRHELAEIIAMGKRLGVASGDPVGASA